MLNHHYYLKTEVAYRQEIIKQEVTSSRFIQEQQGKQFKGLSFIRQLLQKKQPCCEKPCCYA